MKNQRYWLVCKEHQCLLEDNEAVGIQWGEPFGVWVFIDDEVDLSGMLCPDGGDEDPCDDSWEAVPETGEGKPNFN